MSDSEDDWFSKDFDEVVKEIKLKRETQVSFTTGIENELLNRCTIPPFLFEDNCENYELPKSSGENKRVNQNKEQTISHKKLRFLAQLNSSLDLFMEVLQNDCGYFEALANTNPSDQHIAFIIKIYSKLLNLPMQEFKYDFIHFFINSNEFLNHIINLMQNIFENPSTQKQFYNIAEKSISVAFQVNTEELLNEIYSIIKVIEINYFTNDIIVNFIKQLLDILNKGGSKYNGITLKLNQIYDNIQSDEKRKLRDIYPILEELTSNESDLGSLKSNIIEEKYESVQHYLDIQTNLLRKHFIIPLRESVQEIKKSKDIEKTSAALKIYKTVRFMFNNDSLIYPSRKGEMILVDLKANQRDGQIVLASNSNFDALNDINQNNLKFGSLLCFATDINFDNLVLAIVSESDAEMILKGYIQVEIIQVRNVDNIYNQTFLMFESEVYFEPYNHVYKVLQNLHETNFPMVNNIVNIDKSTHLPDYLSKNREAFYKYEKFTFNPVDYSSYPTAEALKLNESQLKAYQHALSNKFTLIEGPTGSGKTYTAAKILTTLLISSDNHVLVICYTNHALDQLLENIINVTDSLVRMGNRSKNDKLDKFNMKHIKVNTDSKLKACMRNINEEYTKKFKILEQLRMDYKKKTCKNLTETYIKILDTQQDLRKISKKLDVLRQIKMYDAIKGKRIIGMTATFASRFYFLLQILNTPIVIIEEADQLLEPHVVASLTKHTQHLILIGQRLKQERGNGLDDKMQRSLFGRMKSNNVNFICLNKIKKDKKANRKIIKQ